MCVEKKSQSTVKKRSILSRTRRSGHVEHSMVKETLENLGDFLKLLFNIFRLEKNIKAICMVICKK